MIAPFPCSCNTMGSWCWHFGVMVSVISWESDMIRKTFAVIGLLIIAGLLAVIVSESMNPAVICPYCGARMDFVKSIEHGHPETPQHLRDMVCQKCGGQVMAPDPDYVEPPFPIRDTSDR